MICKQEKSKKKKNEGLWEISEIVLSGRAERRVPFSTFFEVSVQRQCRRYRDTTCKVVWLLFFFFSGTVQIFSFMSRKQKKKKCANIMACKCSNFCSAHSPSPSFCLSAELLFHPHGPGVLAKLSVQVPALLLSKIPSPQDWAQCLVSPGSPAPNRSQELMAAIFLTLREQLLRDVTRRAEACGNQRQSLGLRCSASL